MGAEGRFEQYEQWRDRILRDLQAAIDSTGSPIERLFLCALFQFWDERFSSGIPQAYQMNPGFLPGASENDCVWGVRVEEHFLVLTRVPITVESGATYRADFVLCYISFPKPDQDRYAFVSDAHVIIECDGHEFHERTKAQVRHDKRRDRELQAIGWRILHLSGSEIFRDPRAAVREAGRFVNALWRATTKGGGK